jgi:hypothetical protein
MQSEVQKQIENDHHLAMQLTDDALAARRKGDHSTSIQYFRAAFEAERRAAEALFASFDIEPTRSILYRSAGYLALDCGETREAERMAAAGLTGTPPSDIAEQLRDLIERVNFQRHLDLRGVDLHGAEIQLSLSGKAVDFGSVEQSVFTRRVDSTEKIALRLAERRTGKEFEERIPKSLRREFNMYVSVPRAASYAVTLRFGSGPDALPGLDQRDELVAEMLECLDCFRKDDEVGLRAIIKDETYFNNFVGLARLIEPDGANLSTVGFTAMLEGKRRQVNLSVWDQPEPTKIRRMPNTPRPVPIVSPSPQISVIGVLLHADERQRNASYVHIRTETQGDVRVSVPAGFMSDVVGQFWDTTVKITGKKFKGAIQLSDIESVDPT